MSDPIDLRHPGRPIRVGVILLNAETEILDVAPVDIFSALSPAFLQQFPDQMLPEHLHKEAIDVEFYWVNESGKEASLTAGAKVNPTHSFNVCPTLDIAVMGAHVGQYEMSSAEVAFIRKTYDHCRAFLCICGGMKNALQAGLLEGKTATAPRFMIPMLQQTSPNVNWVTQRWATSDKMWTSGALLNGLDMTKAFVTQTWGGEGTLADWVMSVGSYPSRQQDYSDEPWNY